MFCGHAAQGADDVGNPFDFFIIFGGNGLELLKRLFLSLDILLMMSPHVMFAFSGRYEPDQGTSLIQRAGRLIHPQGRLTLSMSANPAVRDDILHYLDALDIAA